MEASVDDSPTLNLPDKQRHHAKALPEDVALAFVAACPEGS